MSESTLGDLAYEVVKQLGTRCDGPRQPFILEKRTSVIFPPGGGGEARSSFRLKDADSDSPQWQISLYGGDEWDGSPVVSLPYSNLEDAARLFMIANRSDHVDSLSEKIRLCVETDGLVQVLGTVGTYTKDITTLVKMYLLLPDTSKTAETLKRQRVV